MKRKHLALLLAAAMTVTSVDATALVSAADFSAEVTEDAAVQEDEVLVYEGQADVDITDDEADAAETDSEEATAAEVDLQDDDEFVTDESTDVADTDELFSDGGESAEEAGEQSSFIPTTGVTAMNLDTEYTINFTKQGEEKWYSFTPTETRSYLFTSDNDAVGYVYGADARSEYDYLSRPYGYEYGVRLNANQTYYYRVCWNTASGDYTQSENCKVKVSKAPVVKSVTLETGRAKTSYYQGVEYPSFEGSSFVVEYEDGMRLSSNVEYFDESDIDEGYFYGYYGYYDSLTGIKYKIGVSGAEENNKDIKNVFNESLKKAGKYKVQIYEYGSTDAIGEGYEINILPASSLPELKTGTNSDIKEMQWYKYVPEVTGLYYIPNVNVIRDQDFEYCNSKGETAYFLEKGKEYYMRFIVWDLDQKEITIEQSPKVTGITIKPNANEGVWAESRTRIEGQYVITTESGSEVEGDYYMSNDVHDKYGHLITVEVKDADGNLIQDFSKELKPGKYTYQVKVDGAETEIYTYTVKEPSVYKQLKVGKNDVTLDEKYNSSVGYYQFIPESTAVYEIQGSGYGYIESVYYMDENGDYQSIWEDGQDWINKLQQGRIYYIQMVKENWGEEENRVNGTITITKLEDEACEWSSPVVKTPATCGKAGEAVETCKVHGDTRTVTIPATGKHTYEWNVVKAPTAVAAGSQVQKCSVCGATGKTETIAKLPATLTLNVTAKKTVPMKVKQSFTVKATGLANGDGVKSWKSNKPKIATVSRNGKITAKKTGTATITVTLNSGYTTWFKVKVQKSAVNTTSLKVLNKATGKNAAKKVTLKRRGKLNLSAVVAPATSKQKVTFSSSKKSVATVNSKGVVTAKKKGKATITVKSGKKTVKIQITVK